eukprot:4944119-Prymnesium_polylepis.1
MLHAHARPPPSSCVLMSAARFHASPQPFFINTTDKEDFFDMLEGLKEIVAKHNNAKIMDAVQRSLDAKKARVITHLPPTTVPAAAAATHRPTQHHPAAVACPSRSRHRARL